MRLDIPPLTEQTTQHTPHTANLQDSVLVSSLITAPAWSVWLSEINGLLTTLSLLIGVTIGAHRLWRIVKKPPKGKGPQQPPATPL
ncbi:MAG: hypothetical protein DHS20C08_02990 [Rhodomicrobium sp.]|nr:MAG: hypothetical protein DHS20C08_02990 [Rhodomicrobium sp.]